MTDANDNARVADLDRRIARAPTDVEPPTDLWPNIASAIRAETTKLDELAVRLDPERAPPAELWQTIRARVAPEATSRYRRRAALPIWWAMTSPGLAATLALGILIGRQSSDDGGEAVATVVEEAVSPDGRPLPASYRRAVGEHLRAAETVLVLFNSSSEPNEDLVRLARELAATSRLLSASRAGNDPEIHAMLLDLELLLMQVARVVDADSMERQVAREGTADDAVLARLRLMIAEEAI